MSEGGATLNERLTDIGLDEKEASVIILLATSEPLKASAVGRMVGISRMDSYNTLKRLQERGLVMSTLDKPMRFTGLEIEEVFQDKAHSVPLKSGSAVFWTGRTLHYASGNFSDKLRRQVSFISHSLFLVTSVCQSYSPLLSYTL